jgi:hypothetical protein
VSSGEWHHVVASIEIESEGCPTFAGVSSPIEPPRITLYVDGFAYPLGVDEPFPPEMPSATNLLGAREGEGGPSNLLAATVDSAAIYGHPLEESDVQAHLAVSDAPGPSVILVPPLDPEDGDSDEDGVRDSIDNCPEDANASQDDADADGVGDACQVEPDADADGVPDEADNCPEDANEEQTDSDENGVGDVCEEEGEGEKFAASVGRLGGGEAEDDLTSTTELLYRMNRPDMKVTMTVRGDRISLVLIRMPGRCSGGSSFVLRKPGKGIPISPDGRFAFRSLRGDRSQTHLTGRLQGRKVTGFYLKWRRSRSGAVCGTGRPGRRAMEFTARLVRGQP